jgi:hypothetical protein
MHYQRLRALATGLATALIGLLILHAQARAQGVGVALTPSAQEVLPGAVFSLDISVPVAGQLFNGFDAAIQYDPAALTLIPRSPISLQEGALMVGTCGTTFHRFRQGADTDTITDVLLCNHRALTGPGQIYHLQFQASTEPQITEVDFLPGVKFYNEGLIIDPTYSTNAIISIGYPSDTPRSVSGSLKMQVRPNPIVDRASVVIEGGVPGVQRLTILDLQGRVVRRFEMSLDAAVTRVVRWDRRDAAGTLLPSGVYFVKCDMGGHSVSARVSLVR